MLKYMQIFKEKNRKTVNGTEGTEVWSKEHTCQSQASRERYLWNCRVQQPSSEATQCWGKLLTACGIGNGAHFFWASITTYSLKGPYIQSHPQMPKKPRNQRRRQTNPVYQYIDDLLGELTDKSRVLGRHKTGRSPHCSLPDPGLVLGKKCTCSGSNVSVPMGITAYDFCNNIKGCFGGKAKLKMNRCFFIKSNILISINWTFWMHFRTGR